MDAWTGKILLVDMDSGECSSQELSRDDARQFLGGRGLAVRLASREGSPQADPLSGANRLVIAAGALTGTGAPSASVATLAARSPLTGGMTSADLPGHIGAELKFAGYDAVVISGRASSPRYLAIIDGRAKLLAADHLWGEPTDRAEAMIRQEIEDPWKGRELHILSIGPAGERMANLATVASRGRLAQGGAGLGAVMGSKQLKAIAVRGSKGLTVADGQSFFDAVTGLMARLRNASSGISRDLFLSGTTFLLEAVSRLGALPVKNFSGQPFMNLEALSGKFLERQLTGRRGCFACPVACLRATCVRENGMSSEGEGPGFEGLTMLGTNCGVDSLAGVTAAGYACRSLGLDPVSTGATIAQAMELYELGLIGPEDVHGELSFGDPKAVLRLVRLIGLGQDMGCILGNGAYNLCAYTERPDLFAGAKGREMPGIDPRAAQGMGLHMATSNSGPYHLTGPLAQEVLGSGEDARKSKGKAATVKEAQDWHAAASSLGFCSIALMGLDAKDVVNLARHATGLADLSAEELMCAGERIVNLERAFNVAAGVAAGEDRLSERLMGPIAAGAAKGSVCRLSDMLPEYYRLRGWDDSGAPNPEKLASLGLE